MNNKRLLKTRRIMYYEVEMRKRPDDDGYYLYSQQTNLAVAEQCFDECVRMYPERIVRLYGPRCDGRKLLKAYEG